MRHNDIPATERPAPKSPVSEPVTASGADTVLHMLPLPYAGIIMTQIRRAQPRLGVSHM